MYSGFRIPIAAGTGTWEPMVIRSPTWWIAPTSWGRRARVRSWPRHFEELVAATAVQAAMRAGLDALYQRNDPAAAVARFREVLARNPTHYGATLQLAKALDRSGCPERSARDVEENPRDG
jgi:tetratricopeptide repeat protein